MDYGLQYRGRTGNGRRGPMVRRMREPLVLCYVEILIQNLSTTAVSLGPLYVRGMGGVDFGR